ncbi:MAG TPA: amidohydrolase/deacetylase family metallohydrolase [Candidatus Solibacter sp.]|jgi:dihydroorotase|nr:amidohydrolase/deacetylase family metallohydrolase [Candidatus Solibacter sp.]
MRDMGTREMGNLAAGFLLIAACASAQTPYDLLLKGGHVIDARNNLSAISDVAIAQGKIAAVAANIPASEARQTIDVSGLYVTPGLVDIHVHVFAASMQREYLGENGVRPDGFTFRSGVTTVVDAGSSGWRNFGEFRDQIINRSKTRVFAMLNIVGSGMGGRPDVEQNTKDMEPRRTAEVALRHKDVVVGIKTAHYAGPEWIAVDRAVEAARLAGIPVMVDYGNFRPERPFQELVLKHLRPGDIYTHLYLSAVPMLDESGKVLPYLFEARRRGVIFDVGHGGGSFSWPHAIPAVKQGFTPDSISTDLHTESMNAGMKDMLNVLSKFLNMGMSLDDAIARATWHPAREIHHDELGHLSVGAPADVAVLRLVEGDFGFVDSAGLRMHGTRKLVGEMTLRDGRVVWDLNGMNSEDWEHARK